VTINRAAVEADARLDGKFVLRRPDLMRDLAQVQAVTVTLDGAAPAAHRSQGQRASRLRGGPACGHPRR
jgi:hypothetical protein